MATDFLKELEVQRGYLLRVARLQLRDTALAEDVVQDTLTAALTAQGSFSGKSSVKTWLTGILKQQGELFDEIEENLQSSIEELFGAQSGNLEKIDGKKFVDFFEDVDDILSQGSGTGNGNED